MFINAPFAGIVAIHRVPLLPSGKGPKRTHEAFTLRDVGPERPSPSEKPIQTS